RTTATPRSETDAATGLMTSRPGASGSTTTARLSLTGHLHSRSALPSRPCCAELRHDLLGEPAELLEHHRLRCAHADAHVDVLESREPGLEVLEVRDELLGRAGEPRPRLHVVLDGGDAGGAPAATTRRRLDLGRRDPRHEAQGREHLHVFLVEGRDLADRLLTGLGEVEEDAEAAVLPEGEIPDGPGRGRVASLDRALGHGRGAAADRALDPVTHHEVEPAPTRA